MLAGLIVFCKNAFLKNFDSFIPKYLRWILFLGKVAGSVLINLLKFFRTTNYLTAFPANICWYWRRLQHVFSVTILRFPRSLEDVLKTSWRHVLRMSWRYYGDKQDTYWGYLYRTNLNVYLTNLYLTNLHLTILRWIQNALSRIHHFNICFISELNQHLYFKN